MQKLFYHDNRLLQSIWQRIKTFLLICNLIYNFVVLPLPLRIIGYLCTVLLPYILYVPNVPTKKFQCENMHIVLLLWYAKENNHFSGSFHFTSLSHEREKSTP